MNEPFLLVDLLNTDHVTIPVRVVCFKAGHFVLASSLGNEHEKGSKQNILCLHIVTKSC